MDDDAAILWALERGFWTDGPDAYRAYMDPDCLMAFPAPAGLLHGEQIVRALEGSARWQSVTLEDTRLARPAADLAVLAYRALAAREDGPRYRAYCTSTYRRGREGWRLVQHQQSPA